MQQVSAIVTWLLKESLNRHVPHAHRYCKWKNHEAKSDMINLLLFFYFQYLEQKNKQIITFKTKTMDVALERREIIKAHRLSFIPRFPFILL